MIHGGALLLRAGLRDEVQGDRCGFVRRRMRDLAVIVGQPLRIVRKLGEAPFKPLIFAHLVRAVRHRQQIGVFDRLGAILLSSEHGRIFL